MPPIEATPFARLVAAIEAGDVAAAELAVLDGADAKGPIMWMGDGTPVLVRAAELGHLNIVNLLLNHGADIHARAFVERQSMFHDDDTYLQDMASPIEAAISRRHLDVAELLLQRGANPANAVAESMGQPVFLRLVLDRGASPDGGHLRHCVTSGTARDLESLHILLEYGADPNQIGWGQMSLIRNAIEFGHIDIARALLAAGATMPTVAEVQKAVDDACMRNEPAFRERALATARALGFDVAPPLRIPDRQDR